MQNGFMRCPRCNGRKKLYKMNSGYSHVNCGGPEVECPMCQGKGECETPEAVIERGKQKLEAEKHALGQLKTPKKSKQVDIEECC